MDILQAHGEQTADIRPHHDYECPQVECARTPFTSITDKDTFDICDTLLSADGNVSVTATGMLAHFE
jgi:hypothetical protein